MNKLAKIYFTFLLTIVFSNLSMAVDRFETQELKKYMLELAKMKGDQEFVLDLSDEKQFAFVKNRLMNDKKGSNTELLAKLEQGRLSHGNEKEKWHRTEAKIAENDSVDHVVLGLYLSQTDEISQPERERKLMMSAYALTSTTEEVIYSHTDVLISDLEYNYLSNIVAREDYGQTKRNEVVVEIDFETFKQEHPSIQMAIIDSLSIYELENGDRETKYKAIKVFVPSYNAASGDLVSDSYHHVHPADLNQDGYLYKCLNHVGSECDYAPVEFGEIQVKVPFKGKLTLPHRVVRIYQAGDTVEGVDEQTNIKMLAEEKGSSETFMDPMGKLFFDYLHVTVDEENKVSIIEWDIPVENATFNDPYFFGIFRRVDWWLTIVAEVNPYFESDITVNALFTKGTLVEDETHLGYSGQIPLRFSW